MPLGLSRIQNKNLIILRGFLALIVIAGLSGCVPATPMPLIVCTPESPDVNIYRTAPRILANMIFEYAYPTIPTPAPSNIAVPMPPNQQKILEGRYAAFQNLKNQAARWSDIETINLDDSNEIQIIITFISPELIQAVFLNKVFKDGFITSDFDIQVQNILNSIAARDELLFLVTVTATNNNMNSDSHVIDIPINELILNNAGNLASLPKHDDHNLDQPINPLFEPVFGYIAYPLAILKSDGCNWVLDPKYNTNIVITLSDIKVDNAPSRPYTWTIPYKSLVDTDDYPDPLMFMVPPGFDPTQILPLSKPPYPMTTLTLPNGSIPDMYWQDFGRFIWNQITLGNY